MGRIKPTVLSLAIAASAGLPRLLGLRAFTSIDEPFWLYASSNFYYALGQRDFANTVYAHHPAVTTMWIIAVAMLIFFPEFRAMGQGYLKQGKYYAFLQAHARNPLDLLEISRALQVLVVVVLLVILFLLLRNLADERSAFTATMLVSVSPFFFGHSRLLNHEALLALLLIISLLSLLAYLKSPRVWGLLILSGVAAGLGQLTKSPGALLVPVVGLIMLVDALKTGQGRRLTTWTTAVGRLAFWLLVMALAYVALWPGMWVAPGKMLYEVYGNALSYTFQGTTLETSPVLQPSQFHLGPVWSGLGLYLSDVAWRTTLIAWGGLCAAGGFAVWSVLRKRREPIAAITVYALLLGACFVLLFSLQLGRRSPHYVLTTFVCLDLVAGLGISRLIDHLAGLWPPLRSGLRLWAVLGAILLLQAADTARFYPYYITYYNSAMGAVLGQDRIPVLNGTGYGVGLDQAAAYLSRKENASSMTVMSANGFGSFSFYFPGRTVPMNALQMSDPVILEILKGSDYAVVDYYNQRRAALLSGIEDVRPEKTIWIDGIDFLHIYRASDLLESSSPQ